ncbi:sugar phosphate isomerase/epimerase family protein [Cerasicoccus frondis]|uniref:sugar phosphate isomerase/epimerase family protein n=1 Tax=Cerasicoccus frondis TaxID=490090 RepID=UPI0028527F22|nr:sugar phosphate isomerase/epimerase [Cerasicoccus frondis]
MSTSPARDFGVQSFCFRTIKNNADVAAKVKEIGLNKIEVCAIHADFADPEGFKEIVKTYTDAGVSICSIGVETFTGLESDRVKFECAAAAGAKHISAHFRIDSFLKAVPQVRAWSQEFGIRVGIHCHGGYMFGGNPDELEYLINLGGPEIGLCIDTAWCMQIGPRLGNPIEWAKKFAGKIYGVHYKDFTFEPTGKWNDVIVGTGNLDLPGFVKALEDGGFDGMAVIEYEGDPDNPVPPLKQCVASMRAAT